MNLLLDTHALLWALSNDARLGAHARGVIGDPENQVFVSVVSLWEIALKIRIGKLTADLRRIVATMPATGYQLLAIEPRHLVALETVPNFPDHRDPFDHLLIAQAIVDGHALVSEDQNVARYPVQRIRCSDQAAGR
jgi:PIN domain nuclease of toxin-antitoxin system